MPGINLGGRTVFAASGPVPEEHGRLRYRVPLLCLSNETGRNIGGFILINSTSIFNAIKAAGIVFSGPAPFDAEHECMRFMFADDARAFYEAFHEYEALHG